MKKDPMSLAKKMEKRFLFCVIAVAVLVLLGCSVPNITIPYHDKLFLIKTPLCLGVAAIIFSVAALVSAIKFGAYRKLSR